MSGPCSCSSGVHCNNLMRVVEEQILPLSNSSINSITSVGHGHGDGDGTVRIGGHYTAYLVQ